MRERDKQIEGDRERKDGGRVTVCSGRGRHSACQRNGGESKKKIMSLRDHGNSHETYLKNEGLNR